MGSKTKNYPLKNYYSKIFKKYDLVNKLFTFGLDKKWRNYVIHYAANPQFEKILDLCCGTGDIIIGIASKATNNPNLIGFDFSEQMLNIAKQKSKKKHIDQIEFICGEASKMPFDNNSFDLITISFGFRNLTYGTSQKGQHISEIHRVLKNTGQLVILESTKPPSLLARGLFNLFLYLIMVPLGGLVSGDFKSYWYLAKSSGNFYSANEITKLLSNKGFKPIGVKSFLFGATSMLVCEKQ